MALDITTPSEHELLIRDQLREAVLSEIHARNLSRDDLGERLGIPSVIAEALTGRSSTWSVEITMRLADALEIQWGLTIERAA